MNLLKMAETRQKLSEKLNRYRELKKQRGMTLLEIIIVLGIIGVIAAGVVILAQRAYDSKAMTDLANNANTIRTAMKDAYGQTGVYPAGAPNNTLALNPSNYRTKTDSPISKLIALGKLSLDEARNNISSDFIHVGGAPIAGKDNAGYFIMLNGLNQQQCRGLLNQMGNNWDYVQVITGAAAGKYPTPGTAINLSARVAAMPTTPQGILRSLVSPNQITPDNAVTFCGNNSENGIIFGSR